MVFGCLHDEHGLSSTIEGQRCVGDLENMDGKELDFKILEDGPLAIVGLLGREGTFLGQRNVLLRFQNLAFRNFVYWRQICPF